MCRKVNREVSRKFTRTLRANTRTCVHVLGVVLGQGEPNSERNSPPSYLIGLRETVSCWATVPYYNVFKVSELNRRNQPVCNRIGMSSGGAPPMPSVSCKLATLCCDDIVGVYIPKHLHQRELKFEQLVFVFTRLRTDWHRSSSPIQFMFSFKVDLLQRA